MAPVMPFLVKNDGGSEEGCRMVRTITSANIVKLIYIFIILQTLEQLII